jgi:hypothetical protein
VAYGEWIQYESLRPHCDPLDPETLAALAAVVARIEKKVAVAVATNMAGDDRDEVLGVLFDEGPFKPKGQYRRARVLLTHVRQLDSWGIPSAQDAWADLVRQGIEEELDHASIILKNLSMLIELAPLDPERRAYMLADVMYAENQLRDWLRDVRAKLEPGTTEAERVRLGLSGEVTQRSYSPAELTRFLEAGRS